jgi:hypothetical protein
VAQASVVAEKVFRFVIPNEARNLLFRKFLEKADSWGTSCPRNDNAIILFSSHFSL